MSNFKKKKNKIIQQKYKKNYVCSGMNRKIHECISSFILVADSSLITKFKNEKYNLNKNLFSGGPSKIISLNHQMSFHNKQSLPHGEQNFSQTGLYLIRKIITSKNFSTFVSLEKKKTIQSQKQQGIKNQINQVNQLNNKTQNNRIEGIMSQVNNKTRTNIFKITNQSKRSYDENTRQLALCPCSVPELLQHKFVPRIFTYVDSQNYKITQKTNVFLNKTYQKIQKQKARTNTTPLTNLFPFYLNKKFNNYFEKNISLHDLKKNVHVRPGLTNVKNQKNLVFSQVQLTKKNLKPKKQTTKVFQKSYSKMMEINLLTISLASANRIRQWAEKTLPNGKVVGEVINPETVHYKTLKPIKGGLFCERIFGPLKDHECACGKKFNIKNYLSKVTKKGYPLIENNLVNKLQKRYFCRVCDVEYTYSILRRTQLGFIQLASPTTHVWFVKGIPSYIGILLDLKKKHLQNITYNTAILTLEHAFRGRQFLPTSPASIFESWQKIMKTHYPDKYISTANTLADAKATLVKNSKSLGKDQTLLTKKSTKKEMITNNITKKTESTTKITSKNWRKNQKLLYQQNRKKFYLKNNSTQSLPFDSSMDLWPNYLRSNYLRFGVNLAQQCCLSKITTKVEPDFDDNISIFNKKGWFKLTSNVLTQKNIHVKTPSFVTVPQFNNIYVSTQDDYKLLITLLVKNFDWSILSQLGNSCSSDEGLLQHKFGPKPLTYVRFNNLAFFYKQPSSTLEGTPGLTKVQYNAYHLLQYRLKINTKKLFIFDKIDKAAIPLYLLYFSKNKFFLNVLRTKLVSGTYNIFLPALESNLICINRSNGIESSNKKKK